MLRIWKANFLWLALVLSACTTLRAPGAPEQVECPAPPPVETITDGWRFRLDVADAGLSQAWYARDADRGDWTEHEIGRAWEQAGTAYDGVAWYAREVSWEGPQAYLFLADADDRGTVWLDGVEVARLDANSPHVVLELNSPANRAEVVIRIEDEGGFGGLKSPPRLGVTYESVLDEARRIAYLEEQDPSLPPAPSGDAWTMIGGVEEANEALVGIEGGLSPYATAPSAQVWLRNSATGAIVNAGSSARFSLLEATPIVQMQSKPLGGVAVNAVAFYDEQDRAIRWQVAADRQPDAEYDELIIAVRPFRVNRTMTEFCNPILVDRREFWLNNQPYLIAGSEPDAFSAHSTWAGLTYALEPGVTELSFGLPAAPDRELPPASVNVATRLAATRDAWLERASQAEISVPDGAVQAALDASLGYLLLASDPDGPHPGPLAHNAIWTRDAAYMGLALLMRGHEETAKRYVNAVFGGQEADGRVPPIQGEEIPWDNNEWDAQGQAIFLAVQHYRYTGDVAFLRDVFPRVRDAADYIIQLRQQTAADPPPTRGLLPISLSAEDLADGEQHYYWDNYWALVGLEQAAAAADILGTGDGARWHAEADALRQAINDSLQAVMGAPVPYVPASVETPDNSGMARGTTPALHPFPLFAPDDALLRRSFDVYAERWITPFDGGYLHREGQFWTYGGVELANAYLRLNRGDLVHQILGWTLNHQTFPGTYAWAEQVNPTTFAFSGGDMPHAWMASSLTILIRNMLVLEYAQGPDDDALTLFQTAPVWWFEADRQVEARELPTVYGDLSVATSGDLRNEDGRWAGTLRLQLDGAAPPGGFRWQLPFIPTAIASMNGAVVSDNWLLIPSPGEVTLTFE